MVGGWRRLPRGDSAQWTVRLRLDDGGRWLTEDISPGVAKYVRTGKYASTLRRKAAAGEAEAAHFVTLRDEILSKPAREDAEIARSDQLIQYLFGRSVRHIGKTRELPSRPFRAAFCKRVANRARRAKYLGSEPRRVADTATSKSSMDRQHQRM